MMCSRDCEYGRALGFISISMWCQFRWFSSSGFTVNRLRLCSSQHNTRVCSVMSRAVPAVWQVNTCSAVHFCLLALAVWSRSKSQLCYSDRGRSSRYSAGPMTGSSANKIAWSLRAHKYNRQRHSASEIEGNAGINNTTLSQIQPHLYWEFLNSASFTCKPTWS